MSIGQNNKIFLQKKTNPDENFETSNKLSNNDNIKNI